jgi:DNA-binding GntR family transcriptional regulator
MNLRSSTVDAVANQLRRELLLGVIPPGSRVLQTALAKRYSVSHIPVREALRRLEAEGLVSTTPQGATFAAEIGLEDLSGLYELRRITEGEFASRAAVVRDEGDVATVRECYQRMADAALYSEEFFAAHRDFHWALLAPAAGEVSHRVLDGLWQSVDRYVMLAVTKLEGFASEEHVSDSHREHAQLLEAFELGDGEALRANLLAHLTRTEDRLRATFEEALSGAQVAWSGSKG